MHKERKYPLTRFPADVIREAKKIYETEIERDAIEANLEILLKDEADAVAAVREGRATKVQKECVERAEGSLLLEARRTVSHNHEEWSFDSDAEFLAAYRRAVDTAWFELHGPHSRFQLYLFDNTTSIEVEGPTREKIESVFEVFEQAAKSSRVPAPPPIAPKVFIGHGRSAQWASLKDHLHEQHGYDVAAYEIGARAGHAIRDILEELLDQSSFALLVMTAEDQQSDGRMHPRLNVVHEAGLFQGRLGPSRAVILLEEGTEEFSNIHGIQQIRFSRGNIRETFGEVLAALRREFG